jgi:putative tricarboxylic transport membrane protein
VSSAAPQGAWLESALGIALAAAGGYFAFASSRLPAGPDPSAPGPGVAPGFLGLALVACGLLLAIRAVLAQAAQRKAAASTEEGTAATPGDSLVKPGIAIVLLTASALLLEPLGFMLSTFLFLCAGFVWLGSADWRAAIPAAALTSVSLWLFFTKLLGVGLPFGRLVEILFY